jgi:hypothetical protein
MKKIIYLLLGIVSVIGIVSCDLEDNIDPKNPSEVSVEALLTTAEIAFVDQVNNMSVNRNISRLLAQYWMQRTYPNESRYNFLDRGIPDTFWAEFYRDVLMDLEAAKKIIDEKGFTGANALKAKNQVAIMEILEVYTFTILAETFGNIPYSEAFLGRENTTPKYDDAAIVYADLLVRLNKAISDLDSDNGTFGAADLLFSGDVDSWMKFANSLKLRMGMRMADLPGFNSKTVVEEAVAAGVYSANLEGAFFKYIGSVPYQNTIYEGFVVDARKDYIPSETLIDIMNAVNDPRLPYLFTLKGDAYVGKPYGITASSSYSAHSHFSETFFDPKLEVILADYSEMEFFLAEAVERGYVVGGTAESHYNNAITANILYYAKLTGADASLAVTAAADYLAQPGVAYTTATGTWQQKIGTQKWIAMYNRGIEGWTEWRRLDFPILAIPTGKTYADIPVRYPYPFDENEMNEANYDAAAAAIGGDEVSTRLWWDIN